MMVLARYLRNRLGLSVADDRGGAAVEFAVLAPVLGIILAGAVDFGAAVYMRSQIENAVSAGANFAIVNATKVTAAEARGLGRTVAAYLGSSSAINDATIVVNNGPSVRYSEGRVSDSGSGSPAGSCYCPSIDNRTQAVAWGSAAACGSNCAAGGRAGKFVVVSAQRNYSPLFSSYGLIANGTISVRTIVQTE